VVIVAGEAKSRHIAQGDVLTAALFGDGAVALRMSTGCGVSRVRPVWLEPYVDSNLVDNIRVESTKFGPRLLMENGRLMFRKTVGAFVTMIERAMVAAEASGMRLARVFVHQANAHLLAEVQRQHPELHIPILMSDVGNTVSVALPLHRIRVLVLLALAAEFGKDVLLGASVSRGELLRELAKRLGDKKCDDHRGAFEISCRYGPEALTLVDAAAAVANTEASWLAQIQPVEWQAFFEQAFSRDGALSARGNERSSLPFADAWIGAGGGFQALGFVQECPVPTGLPILSMST
jgi:hypothetical protein